MMMIFLLFTGFLEWFAFTIGAYRTRKVEYKNEKNKHQ